MGRRGASLLRLALATHAAASAALGDEHAPARLLSFGTFTAESTNPTVSSTGSMGPMGSMVPGAPMMGSMPQPQGAVPMLSMEQQEEISKDSAEFMQALIQSFLNKQQLQKGELDCIVDNSGPLGGNVGRVAGQFGVILKQAFGGVLPDLPGPHGGDDDASAASAGLPSSSSFMGDGAGSIEDKINQIQAQGSDTGTSSITSMAAGSSSSSAALQQALAKLKAPQGALAGPAASTAPAAPLPATQATASASGSGEGQGASSGDPSLSLFYSSGRRLQALPGMPAQQSSPGGLMGMMGGQAGMSAFPLAMELGFSMNQIVKESKELVGECIHTDAKAAFELAGNHMRDMKYMTGHFLANGADIVAELADSVMAYEHKNVSGFGYDIGKAMRKVLLSNSANGQLPEGMPGEEELGNVTSGMMQGFFGPGSYMDVRLRKDPTTPVHIDMHQCVKSNVAFFNQVWGATMFVFAQKATQGTKSALNTDKGRLQFGTEIAFTMLQVPTALERCNVSPEQVDMIMDSIKAMGSGMSPHFTMPDQEVSRQQLTNDFAKTIKHWSEHQWYQFGHDLGAFLRESAVHFYPQKYSVDASGLLRRQLLRPAAAGSFPLFLVPAATLLAAGLVAAKHRRTIAAWRAGQGRAASREAEASEDLEAARGRGEARLLLVDGAGATDAVE